MILSCENDSISNQEEFYTYEFEYVELIGSNYKSKLSKNYCNKEFESLILNSKSKTNFMIPKNILKKKMLLYLKNF
jgi:hypothetical protein